MKAIKIQRNDSNKTEVGLWKLSETCYKVKFDNPYASITSPYGTLAEAEEAFDYYCEKAKQY